MVLGRCNSALWGQGSHRDRLLAPRLAAADVYEPFLLIFMKRWHMVQRALRRYPSIAYRLWNIRAKFGSTPLYGPMSYFFEQVFQLGWIVLQDGVIQSADGVLWDVRLVSKNQVLPWVQDAWVASITGSVREDEQFPGLQPLHLQRARKQFATQTGYNVCLANYSVGAIMSYEVKAKFLSLDKASCPLCGQHGSAEHLLYECGATQRFRDDLDVGCLQSFANFIRLSGLFPVRPELRRHRTILSGLPDFQAFPGIDDTTHLCTDGSTLFGSSPEIALSSWSLLLAEPGSLKMTAVASGLLPEPSDKQPRGDVCSSSGISD